MSSSETWRLHPDAEREILLPWLDEETDVVTRLAVVRFVDSLLVHPIRPELEDGSSGIYTVDPVPGTTTGVVWLIDPDRREVVLAWIG